MWGEGQSRFEHPSHLSHLSHPSHQQLSVQELCFYRDDAETTKEMYTDTDDEGAMYTDITLHTHSYIMCAHSLCNAHTNIATSVGVTVTGGLVTEVQWEQKRPRPRAPLH